jgi:large conductance mechanosensitive channel
MEKLKLLLHEFKEFALRGNAVDLAVGVVIGAAFSNMVQALVNDVIMPPLGWLTGGVDFKDKEFVFHPIKLMPGQVAPPPVKIQYGLFLNSLINLLIVAAAIFVVIKLMNMIHHKPADTPQEPPLTTDQKLLTEIRDLLKDHDERAV